MKNKVLRCQDCCSRFVFTKEQQEYYAEQNWEPPIRCPLCRSVKRLMREKGTYQPEKLRNNLLKERKKGWIEKFLKRRKKR